MNAYCFAIPEEVKKYLIDISGFKEYIYRNKIRLKKSKLIPLLKQNNYKRIAYAKDDREYIKVVENVRIHVQLKEGGSFFHLEYDH